jgi:hypothetical protein
MTQKEFVRMKSFISVSLIVAALFAVALAAGPKAGGLPQLHLILPYTFSAPYSCNGNYNTSALFLTQWSLQQNHPELLYNGACRSQLIFQCDTAGRDMSVISYV